VLAYPNLFSPIKVGGVVFRNRILASPTGHTDIRADKTLGMNAILYYERKAKGGAAAVSVGECQVDLERGGRGGPMLDMADFRSTASLQKIADRVARHGAIPSAEINHAGRYGAAGLGPSAGDVDGRRTGAMTEREILETIDAYAKAAESAKMRGFGMVTVHGGHGWLPQQFFSPFTNSRDDEWGGSAANRARFAVAVCDAIHSRCGADFPVEFRISATEFDLGYGVDGGVEYAKFLDGHADIIHVSVAVHGTLSDDGWLATSPGMFSAEGALVEYAAWIKKSVAKSRVATVGSLTNPAQMEEIIASGQADFVAIARGLLADPDLPNKARAGRADDIRVCLRCMSCWSNLMSGGMFCAINPETSREAEVMAALPPAKKKRVLIAGGGIAGMQAAVTSAENGHDVVLCEKSGELGGVIRCERAVPFKSRVDRYIKQQERKIRALGVDVRLGTRVTPPLAETLRPDVIIAAIGSAPVRPPVKGLEECGALSAQEAFRNPERTGAKTVIIGAGLAGCELAIYLTSLGREVAVVELGGGINAEGMRTHGLVLGRELRLRGLRVHFGTRAVSAERGRLVCESDGCETSFDADTVVYAAGQSPLYDEAMSLSALAPSFHMIGDCNGVRNIGEAVKTAFTIAGDIGRYE
jgi:2,4-dienoyl-CoA reductase-like NADH-dependent reductase (Old Yellow Enzyme family)/thioredoxin reductase